MRHLTEKGVTLIEMIIVVAIIVILAFALSFTYQGWAGRYKVESNVKQLYADLMDGRAKAMDRNRGYFVDFPSTTSYQVVEDSNDNGSEDIGAGKDTILPSFPKTVQYPFFAYSFNGGATMTAQAITGVQIAFDRGGRISVLTLLVDPTNPLDATTGKVITGIISFTASSPTQTKGAYDYDCLSISPSGVAMGEMDKGVCYVK